MTKVCHMTSAHGAEDVRIFHKECVSLARAGYDVYLVQRGESYEKNGVHIVGVGEIPASRRKRMTRGARTVYEAALALDADIYHFHDPELLPYGLKLKKKGKKVIFDSHEYYTEQIRCKQYLPHWVANMLADCYGRYENSVLQKLDAVVFPCTMSGKNPFSGLCRRAVLVNNAAILDELVRYRDESTKEQHGQICYVGGLMEDRGIMACIRAASAAGAKLVLAGAFDSAGYEAQVRAMPEWSCVEFRGVLDRSDVGKLMAQSCIGLCTLLDRGQYWHIDTFSIKVYEYMSMGLPVILHNSSYHREMVIKYHMGLCVDPEDVQEYAAAIRYLLDNPEEARQMGENGRRAVETEFNWAMTEKKLLALYDDIMKE